MPPPVVDPVRVLVIDDDAKLAAAIAESLERKGYALTVAHTGQAGSDKLEADEFDVILTDLRLADVDGLKLVQQARRFQPDAEVAVISGHNDVRTAQEAMKLGASHYLLKPIDLSELRAIVEKSADRVKLARVNRELRQQLDERFGYEGVVGNGPKMAAVSIETLSNSRSTRSSTPRNSYTRRTLLAWSGNEKPIDAVQAPLNTDGSAPFSQVPLAKPLLLGDRQSGCAKPPRQA